jgi:hypothetical protein
MKIKYLALPAITVFLLSATKALAFCPVCVVAVAGGVGLSRWLGVDDTVTGLWVGALIVASIGWTYTFLKNRKWDFWGNKVLIAILYYLVILGPLWRADIIGHPLNKIWGVDKLVVGVIVGSVFFLTGMLIYSPLKKKNNNRAHFPFEKIVLAIVPIVILSIVFYFITKMK